MLNSLPRATKVQGTDTQICIDTQILKHRQTLFRACLRRAVLHKHRKINKTSAAAI